ncbi:HD domain-containing protein [Ceratobasidium sp. AG-Ba]|nr:HD domain-containing protein [Ceratobasidium sp. AG-Ba]
MASSQNEYPSEAEVVVIAAAENLMEETMKKYDPSHDALHVNRVRKTALALARSQNPQPDLLVVELAALLHDVLDKKYVSAAEAAAPYAVFRPFFESVASHVNLLSDGRAQLIVRIIENVSWTTEKKLRAENRLEQWHDSCIELHCVQDADRLDAIGAFGILRCAAYSASVNRPLHVPSGDLREESSAIGHFHDKLLHIQDRLKTPQGKVLGAQRHQLMLTFLDGIDSEYSPIIPREV